jgi:hypothetical protein
MDQAVRKALIFAFNSNNTYCLLYEQKECLALHLVLVLERKAEISNHLIQQPLPSTMTETPPCYTELSEMTIVSLEFFPLSPTPRE